MKISGGKMLAGAGRKRFVFSCFLFFLTLIFYVWSRYYAAQIGYQLNFVIRKEQNLLEEKRALTLELNNLASLKHIEQVARNQFGMKEIRPEQIRYLKIDEKKE